ncbi:MAG TPA: TetR/AcrR family transcriptional regulator [Acidimicrobiales bacterium]|nr:TetR/AcrR family transcriptional regulator [Acidimicrobiales bacterium]
MSVGVEPAEGVDGRRLRRQRNRDAVVEALLALFAEGNLSPALAEVAERAGLSARSLFRYFDDVDDLHGEAIARQLQRARPLIDPGVTADTPTPEKIERFVAARTRLLEAVAPAARAARASAHRHEVVRQQVERARTLLRRQVATLFAPELDRVAGAGRPGALATVDVLCSFESWELLCHDQGLSRPKARAALVAALHALLA